LEDGVGREEEEGADSREKKMIGLESKINSAK